MSFTEDVLIQIRYEVVGGTGLDTELGDTTDKVNDGISKTGSKLDKLSKAFSTKYSLMYSAFGGYMSHVFDGYISDAASADETNRVLVKGMAGTSVAYQDLYNTIDEATNKGIVSMQDVIPAMYAFQKATGATGEEMNNIAGDFASFGSNALALYGSEGRAKTAMTDLYKGLTGGSYERLNDYGVTSKEQLMETGYWSGEADDIEGYMDAVAKVAGMDDELMNTHQGLEQLMQKGFRKGGKTIATYMLPTMDALMRDFVKLDDSTGGWLSTIVVGGGSVMGIFFQMMGYIGLLANGLKGLRETWNILIGTAEDPGFLRKVGSNMKKAGSKIKDFGSTVAEQAGNAKTKLSDAFSNFKDKLEKIDLSKIKDKLKSIKDIDFSKFKDKISTIKDKLKGIKDLDLSKIKDKLKGIADIDLSSLKDSLKSIKDKLSDISSIDLSDIKDKLSDLTGSINLDKVKTKSSKLKDKIKDAFQKALGKVKDLDFSIDLTSITDKIQDKLPNIDLSGLTGKIRDAFSKGLSKLPSVNLSGLKDKIRDAFSGGLDKLKSINLSGLSSKIRDAFSKGLSKLPSVNLSGLSDKVRSAFSKGLDTLKGINLSGIKDSLSSLASSASGVGSKISDIFSGSNISSAVATFKGYMGELKLALLGVKDAAIQAATWLINVGREALISAASALRSAAAWVAERIAMAAATVQLYLEAAAAKVAAAANWLLDIALDANPVMIIVLALIALVAILVYAYYNVDWFRKLVDDTGKTLEKLGPQLAKWGTIIWDFFANLPGTISRFCHQVQSAVTQIWNNIKSSIHKKLQGIWKNIRDIWNGIITFLNNLGPDLYNAAWNLGKQIWDGFWAGLGNFVDYVKSVVGLSNDASKKKDSGGAGGPEAGLPYKGNPKHSNNINNNNRTIVLNKGALNVDARNLTTHEAKQVLIGALEGVGRGS